jgi:hypothetical protein
MTVPMLSDSTSFGIDSLQTVDTLVFIDSLQVNMNPMIQKHYRIDTMTVDTIIHPYHIVYVIKDYDEIRMAATEKADTIRYAGRDVVLSIEYEDRHIFHQTINKSMFSSYIDKDEIYKYGIHYFAIESVSEDNVCFDLNVCMPDTDICYDFNLYIAKNGKVSIDEIISEEDGL